MKTLILFFIHLWPFGKYTLVGHTNSGEIISMRTSKNPECFLDNVYYMDTKDGSTFFYVDYKTDYFLEFDYYTSTK